MKMRTPALRRALVALMALAAWAAGLAAHAMEVVEPAEGATPVASELRTAAIFGDHMVLQRDMDAPIWGWAAPGEEIIIRASWQSDGTTLSVQTDPDGQWLARVPTGSAGGPYSLSIMGATESLLFQNVMIGEVWVCSGQSNMEMSLRGWPPRDLLMNSEQEIAAARYSNIRLFNVRNAIAVSPKDDCEGQWSQCDPETVAAFSATGYFFGRELHHQLDIPIGLIAPNWGGTVVESWTRLEALTGDPDFTPVVERYHQAVGGNGYQNAAEAHVERMAAWAAQHDPGEQETPWFHPGLDDSDWETMTLPQPFETSDLGDFDGAVWFRKTIDIPQAWEGLNLVLELGPIDDMDWTWFNGRLIGAHLMAGQHQTSRMYTIPGRTIQARRHAIAIRMLDTGGAGGMTQTDAAPRLYPQNQPDQAINLRGEWKYRVGFAMADAPGMPRMTTQFNANTPSALYNGMIAPVIPYGIAGAIWYQGESNRGRAYQYRKLFPTMIRNWREDWGQGDFPFYYVQIAPYNYGDHHAELEEAQTLTLSTPNTGMVVTTDIGNPDNIHPANKQEVGRRLALWALAQTYGRGDIIYSGPLYRAMQIEEEASAIRLSFDHTAGRLRSVGGPLTHFTIAGEDGAFVPATAVIEGETVVVSSPEVASPVAVRFGWESTAEPNLFNEAGLPASPFRTDDWPGVTREAR